MKITEELLRSIASVGADGATFTFYSAGHVFEFNEHESFWAFNVNGGPYHAVSDFEDCLRFVADDQLEAGREQARKDIREALGIKE